MLAPLAASAGQVAGTINWLAHRTDGLMYVSINGTRTGSPSCATIGYFMVRDENSEVGKKQFAMLLAAKATGARVEITGKNTCLRWGDGEDIDEVKLVD
jgi:hypothetical protein